MTIKTIITLTILLGLSPLVKGQDLFPYRKDSLWGFCDSNKNIIIPIQYEYVSIFSNCGISTVKINDKYRFIDKTGTFINQNEYDTWTYFWLSRTYVWKDEKVGLIDSIGAVIIPIVYDDIKFTNGILGLKKGEKWSLFDYYTGKQLTKFKYQEVLTRSSKLKGIKIKDKWGFVNQKGRLKIKPKYDEIKGFSENGLCGVKVGDQWGFINYKGSFIGNHNYEQIQNFQSEGAWVKYNNKWGLINAQGEIVIPFKYEDVSYFKEGLAYVKLNGKYGYIDSVGDTIIPFIYEYAFEFSEGLASVCLIDDSCGYINKEGKTIIPFQFETNFGSEFSDRLAEVRKNNLYGFINKNGEIVVEIKYNSPYDYNAFDNNVGVIIDPKTKQKIYFDRNGTLFYEE